MSEPTDADRAFAAEQQVNAVTRTAVGQCGSCGAYRSDGQPPTIHESHCTSEESLIYDPFRRGLRS